MKLISNQIQDALLKKNNLSDLIDKAMARANLGLGTAAILNVGVNRGNVMEVGAGGLLAGTFISDAADKTSIGARAATGCQLCVRIRPPMLLTRSATGK